MVKSNVVSLLVNAAATVTISLTVESSAIPPVLIPGASVVWTSVSTGATYKGTTNSSGVAAVQMPAGQYYLTVSATGFATFNSTPNTEECLSSWSAALELSPS